MGLGVDWGTSPVLLVWELLGVGVESCAKEAAGKHTGHEIHHSLVLSVCGTRESRLEKS